MITNWQELGEVLAEFNNRLSYLENSQNVGEPEPTEVIHKHINFTSSLDKKQWDEIQQAILDFTNLRKKINELYEKKKPKEVYKLGE